MIEPITATALGTIAPSSIGSKAAEPAIAPTAIANGAGSFADVLASFGGNAVESLNKAEELSISAIRGETGPRELADAVMTAEQSLNMATAVRDKVVTAYLEISRMAI